MTRRHAFLLAAILIIGIALVGCGEESQVPSTIATVDGEPISREMYFDYLDQAYGSRVLPGIVEQQILLNLAEKEGVPVTDEQIDKQLEAMKRDGEYNATVKAVGGEQALRDRYLPIQARINVAQTLYKSTDKDLQAVYDQMKARFVRDAVKTATILATSDEKQFKEAQKAIKNGMDFDAASAKFSHPGFTKNGQQPIYAVVQKGLPQPIVYAAEHTKEGEVSKAFSFTLPQGDSMRAILKVTGKLPKLNLKFADVKDELRATDALRKSQMEPDKFDKKLQAARKKTEIDIQIPRYKYLEEQIKNPPPMMGMPMMTSPQARPAPSSP